MAVYIGLIWGILGSCSTAKYPVEIRQQALTLPKLGGRAAVYVCRTSSKLSVFGMQIAADSIAVGKLFPKEYFLFIVEPGEHVFSSKSENVHRLKVKAEPGQRYYLRVEPETGMVSAQGHLSPVDPIEGGRMLESCSLAGMNEMARNLLNYIPPVRRRRVRGVRLDGSYGECACAMLGARPDVG